MRSKITKMVKNSSFVRFFAFKLALKSLKKFFFSVVTKTMNLGVCDQISSHTDCFTLSYGTIKAKI